MDAPITDDPDALMATLDLAVELHRSGLKQVYDAHLQLDEIQLQWRLPVACKCIGDELATQHASQELVRAIGERIVEYAEVVLALPGAWYRLIAPGTYHHHWIGDPAKFRPATLWQDLTRTLTKPEALFAAYRQEADVLRACFPRTVFVSQEPQDSLPAPLNKSAWKREAARLSDGERLLQAWRVFLCWADLDQNLDKLLPAPFRRKSRRPVRINSMLSYSQHDDHATFHIEMPLLDSLLKFFLTYN